MTETKSGCNEIIQIDDDDDQIDDADDEVEIISSETFFSPEELKGIKLTKRGDNFIEVECGITNNKYGDSVGKLSIYRNGMIEIECDCYPGCNAGKISPSEFEKHAGLNGPSKWRSHIWVFVDDQKIRLVKTKLLKYYKGSTKDRSVTIRPRRGRIVHRDEFMKCTACGKHRRFLLRDKAQCKAYHQAARASKTWTCSDHPYSFMRCEDEERRETKNQSRGCPRRASCKGCPFCVCTGCKMCCFDDCDCRTCLDYILNIED